MKKKQNNIETSPARHLISKHAVYNSDRHVRTHANYVQKKVRRNTIFAYHWIINKEARTRLYSQGTWRRKRRRRKRDSPWSRRSLAQRYIILVTHALQNFTIGDSRWSFVQPYARFSRSLIGNSESGSYVHRQLTCRILKRVVSLFLSLPVCLCVSFYTQNNYKYRIYIPEIKKYSNFFRLRHFSLLTEFTIHEWRRFFEETYQTRVSSSAICFFFFL